MPIKGLIYPRAALEGMKTPDWFSVAQVASPQASNLAPVAAGSFNVTGTEPASQVFGNFSSPGSFQVWLVAQDSQDPPLRQGVPAGVGFAVPDLTPPALEASLVPDSIEAYACALLLHPSLSSSHCQRPAWGSQCDSSVLDLGGQAVICVAPSPLLGRMQHVQSVLCLQWQAMSTHHL